MQSVAFTRNLKWGFSTKYAIQSLLIATIAGLSLGAGSAIAANKSKLSIYQHGKAVSEMPCGTQPVKSRSVVLMGGGIDIPSAFSFMINEMASCTDGTGKPGNFVVVRAGGNPSYDSFIYKQGPVGAVLTIVIPDRESAVAVGDPNNEVGQQVQALLKTAGAIWITGGDQGDYYNFWKGTPVEALISNQVQQYGIPIGGTSAGMMILSEYNFIPDIAYSSSDALNRPYFLQQWLKKDFWTGQNKTPYVFLKNTVTDSHFDARDRMGRLVTFLADVINMGWSSPNNAKAIGVDQETALILKYTPTKTGGTVQLDPPRIVANKDSNGAAYILTASSNSTITVPNSGPLTFTNVNVQKLYIDPITSNTVSKSYKVNASGGLPIRDY